jgi:hypothetical protein
MGSRKRGFAMGNMNNVSNGGNGDKTGDSVLVAERRAGKSPPANISDARELPGAAAEHLSRDFARVRARLAVDPAMVGQSLAAAWTTHVMEEDEAEFVDALADCMGAGLSLETALTGWDSGTLVADPSQEAADEEEPIDVYVAIPMAHQQAPGARRVLVR